MCKAYSGYTGIYFFRHFLLFDFTIILSIKYICLENNEKKVIREYRKIKKKYKKFMREKSKKGMEENNTWLGSKR